MNYRNTKTVVEKFLFSKKLLVLTATFAITATGLLTADNLSTGKLDDRQAAINQEQARILQAINATPPPRDMVPGIINSQARAVIIKTRNKNDIIQRSADNLYYGTDSQLLAVFSGRYKTSAIRQADAKTRGHAQNITAPAAAYSDTLSALANFIEYNPGVDMSEFNKDSDDTDKRLARLDSGLRKSKSHIASIDSPATDDIVDILEAAEDARSRLERTGDTEEFTDTFTQLQDRCIQVLDSYHSKLQPQLRREAIGIAKSIR